MLNKHNRVAAIVVLSFILSACGSDDVAQPLQPIVPENSDATYSESFTGANGSNWPSEWIPVAASTVNADIQNNSGRLQANAPPIVARLVSTTLNMTNFEAKIIIRFEDFANQGIGFYGRQNGGYLMSSVPNGQGYGLFTEGDVNFDPANIGIWEEINGIETRITGKDGPLVPGGLLNNTNYCVRYRVEQLDATQTQLRARIWLQTGTEPSAWDVELISTTAQLQNQAGGFAVDIYNYSGSGSIYFENIEITDLGP